MSEETRVKRCGGSGQIAFEERNAFGRIHDNSRPCPGCPDCEPAPDPPAEHRGGDDDQITVAVCPVHGPRYLDSGHSAKICLVGQPSRYCGRKFAHELYVPIASLAAQATAELDEARAVIESQAPYDYTVDYWRTRAETAERQPDELREALERANATLDRIAEWCEASPLKDVLANIACEARTALPDPDPSDA